jgi:hypothetical protein
MQTKTTRRGLLGAVPALAATMAPAAAIALGELPTQPADDPIFEVISEYKRSWRAVAEADEAIDLAAAAGRKRCRPKNEWPVWVVEDLEGFMAAGQQAVPVELVERRRIADDAYHVSIDGLASTVPTTLAGAAAMVEFVLDDDPQWAVGWHEDVMRNLANVLSRLVN